MPNRREEEPTNRPINKDLEIDHFRLRDFIFEKNLLPFNSSPERHGGGGSGGGIPPKKPEQPRKPDREPGGEHRFKVVAEEQERLFDQLKHVDFSNLGEAALDYPFNKITASTNSGGRRFSAQANIDLSDSLDFEMKNSFDIDKSLLSEKFKIKVIEKHIYILDEKDHPEFEVDFSDRLVLHRIRIKCGGDESNTNSIPLTTFENFDKWLTKFCSIMETVTNAGYEQYKQYSPDIELVLRPSIFDKATPANAFPSRDQSSMFGSHETLKDKLQIEKPNIKFDEIGGQTNAKREIEGLAFALKNPDLYNKWGTKPPKGILLYGPPGTGKTLMAKALATEADAEFLSISVSDITSKWYGESEKLMQEVFDIAKNSSGRTILFFDEVDAIAPGRDQSTEASRRIVSTLLTNLDGIGSNHNVMIVCATNRLDALDPAFTRPGRLDRLVEVGLPDEEGRKQIFGIHIKKAEKIAGRELFNGINIATITAKTGKTSGADIAEIIRRVLEEKVRQEGTTGIEPGIITTEDILKEIAGYERVKEVKRTMGFVSRSEH